MVTNIKKQADGTYILQKDAAGEVAEGGDSDVELEVSMTPCGMGQWFTNLL